jgi:hypothetical protein
VTRWIATHERIEHRAEVRHVLRPALRAGDPVSRGDTVAVILPNAAQMLDARTRSELAAQIESTAARASRARSVVRQSEAAAAQAKLPKSA